MINVPLWRKFKGFCRQLQGGRDSLELEIKFFIRFYFNVNVKTCYQECSALDFYGIRSKLPYSSFFF